MSLVVVDHTLAELAVLDVVDVLPDGSLRLSDAFVAECVAHLDSDPSILDTVVQDRILARALERGYAGLLNADELALAALELGAAEEPDARA